jgi:hypothetical protein
MKRTFGLIVMVIAIASALWSARAQPVSPPADSSAQPPVDPNLVMQAVAEQMEPATQESDATTQPTTEPTTEPTTQEIEEPTTEPTTGPSTSPAAKRFTRSTTRPGSRGSVKWSRRGSNPTTSATTNPSQHPMSNEYIVLQTKSIFVKGHAADTSHSTPGGAAPSTNPTIARPEGSLVFNVITNTNGEPAALVEDVTTGRTTTVKIGDAVAQGKVKSITFDALEYEAAGKVLTVKLGQNFEGAAASGSVTPTGTTSAPSDSGGGDVLERLRRKRAAEMGGG